MIAQLMSDRMAMAQGDGTSLDSTTRAWQATDLGAFKNISDTLEYFRFHKDGRVSRGVSLQNPATDEVAGFTLRGRAASRRHIRGQGDGATTLGWQEQGGSWEIASLGFNTGGIVNTGNDEKEIVSSDSLPANQGAQLTVSSLLKKAQSLNHPYIDIEIGNGEYRFRMLHDEPLRVDRRANGDWVSLRRLEAAGRCNLKGGSDTLEWCFRGGRLVAGIRGQLFHFLIPNKDETVSATNWSAGPVTITAFGCRIRAEIAPIEMTNADGTDMTGSFTIRHSSATVADDSPPDLLHGGYVPATDTVAGSLTMGDGYIEETTTLTPTADKVESPFVTRTMAQIDSQATGSSADALDISPAILSAKLSQAMPPIAAGQELTLEIDRILLQDLFDKKYPGRNWRDYLESYCPITYDSRWHYDNNPPGEWLGYFDGYIYLRNLGTSGVGEPTMTVTCRDPIVRLQKPASIIDHRYPPLDYLYAKKLKGRRAAGAQSLASTALYGAECIYEIIRLALGSGAAYNLNNAAGSFSSLVRYFPHSAIDVDEHGEGTGGELTHYPLMDAAHGGAGYLTIEDLASAGPRPPTHGAWLFPPPFGEDALKWINDIAAKDRAVFFYGHADGYDGNAPVPIYGRITNIIAARNVTHSIPDAIYHTGLQADWDADQALTQASYETRPENDINRALVLANGALGNAMDGLRPAARIAVAQLSPGLLTEDGYHNPDHNAPDFSWERTQVIRDELSWVPGGVEAYAQLFMSLLKNVIYRWPSFTCRGRDYRPDTEPVERPINWGDKVVLQMDGQFSDTGLDLSGNTYRVEHVEQNWTFGDTCEHTVTCWVRPLTAGGL